MEYVKSFFPVEPIWILGSICFLIVSDKVPAQVCLLQS